jgi:hypothetical protein
MVDRDMLTRVWNEIDYRRDVYRITKSGQIEHLRNYLQKCGEFLSLLALELP